MIDLHCHIIPGVDDGPAATEEAVAMAMAAVQDGIRTIVATPHSTVWAFAGCEGATRRKVAALGAELASLGVELELLAGIEAHVTPDLPALFARGHVFTLNASRYILVEFPFDVVPDFGEQTLFELQLRQLVPVIAHPERNSAIARNPGILHRLVSRGMLVQVTSGSLLGDFGRRTQQTAELLVAHGLVHIIASDAHSAKWRLPRLSEAAARVAQLIGREAAEAMVTTIPAAILRDEEVTIPEPRPVQRHTWFSFGRRSQLSSE